jgi:hypothetical protein
MGRLPEYSDAVPGLASYNLAQPAHTPNKQTFSSWGATRVDPPGIRDSGSRSNKHRVNAGIRGGWQQGGRILYENGRGP